MVVRMLGTALVTGVCVAGMALCAAPAGAEDLVEVKIELPQPYFGGTPLDYFGENLEKPNYKPRPPFMAPAGTTNVAEGQPVTSSDPDPEFGELAMLVDGDKNYKKESLLGLAAGHQWIQVDLGAEKTIYGVALWHFHEGERVYFDVAIQASNDPEFKDGVTVIFNNDHDNSAGIGAGEDKEYIESYKAKFIEVDGAKGRYVRFYSKGNTTDDMNHYVEAEVFGK